MYVSYVCVDSLFISSEKSAISRFSVLVAFSSVQLVYSFYGEG